MSAPTDDDQARAQAITGCVPYRARVESRWDFTYCRTHDQDGNPRWGECRWAPVAQALADERDRTLASCFGRHEPATLVVSGPGVVTCDGHELRVTYGLPR